MGTGDDVQRPTLPAGDGEPCSGEVPGQHPRIVKAIRVRRRPGTRPKSGMAGPGALASPAGGVAAS